MQIVSSPSPRDVGHVELELLVAVTEGGPKKRIVCGPVVSHWRRCAVSGVKAVFDVHPSSLNGFLGLSKDSGRD